MANPIQSLNENFLYNSMLTRALMQLIPQHDRNVIRLWLERLHDMDDTWEEMIIRNEYMWFLLLQLQNKKLTAPFNKMPPSNTIRPLKDILPAKVYEDVLMATEESMAWMENIGQEVDKPSEEAYVLPTSHPAKFLNTQPTPRNGIICYFAAFSDQEKLP